MKQKGQSLVEFALIVPMLVALGLSVIYIGLLYVDYTQYSNAARDAARDISVQSQDVNNARKSIVNEINATQNIEPGKFKELESTIVGKYQNRFMGTYWPIWSAQFYVESQNNTSSASSYKKTSSASEANIVEIKIELKLLDVDDNGDFILATDDKTMNPWGGSWSLLPKTLQPITYKMRLEPSQN